MGWRPLLTVLSYLWHHCVKEGLHVHSYVRVCDRQTYILDASCAGASLPAQPAAVLTSVLIDGQAGRRVLDEDVAQPHFELPKVAGYLLLYLLCHQVAPPLGSGQPDFALHPGHSVEDAEAEEDQLGRVLGCSVFANVAGVSLSKKGFCKGLQRVCQCSWGSSVKKRSDLSQT